MFGAKAAIKSGLGTARIRIAGTGIVVSAIVAVNAVGDIVDPKTGKIIAGARKADGSGFLDSMLQLREGREVELPIGGTSTIGVVATNVAFEKVQLTKIAQMAHDGFARTINPVHTLADGDTIFAVATGAIPVKANHGAIGALAAEVMAEAVLRAVRNARGLPGLPAWRDLAGER
jgi:L-aminopeptidase/D-esterase-like protein